jgi:DNA-binding MarR family transcriptional regulator
MPAKDRILALLRDGRMSATNNELAAAADISIVTVDNCLRDLEKDGQIARRRVGRRRRITVLA